MSKHIKIIAIFQVFLVLSLSWIIPIIHSSYYPTNTNYKSEEKESRFNLLKELLTNFIPSVSAQGEPELYCCERTNQGGVCQTSSQNSCDSNFRKSLGSCEETSYCSTGCCIKNGVATENSVASSCQVGGGDFFSGQSCDQIPQAIKGCCILGDQHVFTTESKCEILAVDSGINQDFRQDITTESLCLLEKFSEAQGCCEVGGSFVFTNSNGCSTRGGEFHQGQLCSNPNLNNNCERQSSTGCFEGRDEVFWYDSCGNRENIYDENKQKSWNQGFILEKENSCDPNSDNANDPSCGNCNYVKGSVCGLANEDNSEPKYGEYICKSLTCENTLESDGKAGTRESGESWCVYDSQTGEGQDVVGSRHWRGVCIDGEQIIEPCSDQRQEVCAQGSISINGEEFSEAACITNGWRECLNIEEQNECEENNGCFWFDAPDKWEGFSENRCLSKSSPGFDSKNLVSGEGGIGRAFGTASICSIGSSVCQVVEKKGIFGGWSCKENCECLREEWRETMNDRCDAIGDCGASVNIAGELTEEGYEIYRGPKFGEDTDIEEWTVDAKRLFLDNNYLENLKDVFILALDRDGNKKIGITGNLVFSLPKITIPSSKIPLGVENRYTLSSHIEEFFSKNLKLEGQYLQVAQTAVIFMTMKYLGVGQNAAAIVSIAYAFNVAGFGTWVNGLSQQFLTGLGATGGIFMSVLILFVAGKVLEEILNWLFGIGKTRIRTVIFSCQAALPPQGGENCELCNQDPLRPCSEYRCSTLGTTCQLLNKGTSEELCSSIGEDDALSPRIIDANTKSNVELDLIKGESLEITNNNNGCLEHYQRVDLNLITDEASKCRIDFERTNNFEDMRFWLGGLNFYLKEHPLSLTPPGANEGTEFGLGEENSLFIRCKDLVGNVNANEFMVNFCVNSGPDLTPPIILDTNPNNKGYIPYETINQNVTVFVNEPAECRWDTIDTNYDQLIKEFSCKNGFDQVEQNGMWKCEDTFTDLNQGNNKFYLRCEDKPFANKTERNVNVQSYVYELNVAQELLIDSASPKGEIKINNENEPIEFKVTTKEGSDEGEAFCFYSTEGFKINERIFSQTGSSEHSTLTRFEEGDYNIYLRCRDNANNEAKELWSLKVNVDSEGPRIIRLIKTLTSLILITDEEATCRYDAKDFIFSSGKLLGAENSISHITSLSTLGNSIIVKCRDKFDNEIEKKVIISY